MAGLQADREKLCLNSEALSVDLSVAMPVAEAVLGEAEVLATIVACEELPHHINAPRRLPDNSEVRTKYHTPHKTTLRALDSPQSGLPRLFVRVRVSGSMYCVHRVPGLSAHSSVDCGAVGTLTVLSSVQCLAPVRCQHANCHGKMPCSQPHVQATTKLYEADILLSTKVCMCTQDPGAHMQEHAYVSSRIHRHEILLNRRKQLQPLTATQTHSVNMLQQSIKSRLIFATVRRALQMDALGCKPLGLDVVAFKAVAASSSTSGKDTSMMCYVAPPKRVLLPLVDELLSSYDSYRLALWPVEDPVVKYLSQGVAQDEAWSGYAADPWRRAATARNAVRRFMHAIQATTTDTLLGHLRPHMMSHWTMRISSSKVRLA